MISSSTLGTYLLYTGRVCREVDLHKLLFPWLISSWPRTAQPGNWRDLEGLRTTTKQNRPYLLNIKVEITSSHSELIPFGTRRPIASKAKFIPEISLKRYSTQVQGVREDIWAETSRVVVRGMPLQARQRQPCPWPILLTNVESQNMRFNKTSRRWTLVWVDNVTVCVCRA